MSRVKGCVTIYLGVVVLGCVMFSMSGCRATSNSAAQAQATPLEVSGLLRFDDVPVPFGFSVLQEESFTFENERARVGLLKYKGKSSADQVVAFYREQMPLYNWEMLNVIEFGQRLLNFEKDEQSCIVTVNPERSKILVTIAISPKNAPSKLR